MGEDEGNNVVLGSAEESALPATEEGDPPMDMLEEKSVIQPYPEEKPDEGKTLVVVDKVTDPPSTEKSYDDSTDRYAVLARVETRKIMLIIKAWEDSEKIKAENKAVKKMHSIDAWENTKRAAVEAELKMMQEDLERKKAECAEKMKNKIVTTHKEAEEKRAMLEARRVENILKAEERAAKWRETGVSPKKLLGFF